MNHDNPPAGVLSGIRVIDFSRILAGPFATQILGDLGAEVIKVEAPGGDDSRAYGGAGGGVRPVFASYNRNKKSVVVDLKSEQGREIAQRLVGSADVLVHNYRIGVAEKLGLGYEDLEVNYPRLIYCEITGFGSHGPLRSKAAVDLIAQAYSGLLSFTGEAGRDPVRVPVSISDLTAGVYAALGILSALLWRERGGHGQKIETSLLEALLSLISVNLTQTMLTGVAPQPMGTQNGMGQPNQVFRAHDGLVAVAAANDRMWARFCRAIEAEELAEDPRFAVLASRYTHRDELVEEISLRMKSLTVADCVARCDAAGVVCAPVLNLDQVARDEQVQTLGSIVKVQVAGREVPVVASPLHLSSTATTVTADPPDLGEHTAQILDGLGYDPAQVAELRGAGVVA
ncbi:CaiB/BaiF CoA transferase family protein [Nocardia jinanensis]|uniref:CoA transferase n=1 Tax=Nocardia jinanensis TaxID=382504 RepID=A0A917RMS7_9NOCA|nr:CoA transferase [Nocardia jinanensis]GGL15167.1 CoA transferase [Nocardia jinanensis]